MIWGLNLTPYSSIIRTRFLPVLCSSSGICTSQNDHTINPPSRLSGSSRCSVCSRRLCAISLAVSLSIGCMQFLFVCDAVPARPLGAACLLCLGAPLLRLMRWDSLSWPVSHSPDDDRWWTQTRCGRTRVVCSRFTFFGGFRRVRDEDSWGAGRARWSV